MNKEDLGEDQKVTEVKSLKKSCYRNIFLLLLTTYPTTSKSIIQILPLPGACVETCFIDDKSDCIFLLRADYSIQFSLLATACIGSWLLSWHYIP